jgi:hypothetical protein
LDEYFFKTDRYGYYFNTIYTADFMQFMPNLDKHNGIVPVSSMALKRSINPSNWVILSGNKEH